MSNSTEACGHQKQAGGHAKGIYVDVSDYQGKDPKKWLGDLYVDANKAKIKNDNAAKNALKQVSDGMEAVEGNIKKIELHLNRHRA